MLEGLRINGLAKFGFSGEFTHYVNDAGGGTIHRRSVFLSDNDSQQQVTRGGHHPLLAPDENATVASQHLLDIFPKDNADAGKVAARKGFLAQASKFYGPPSSSCYWKVEINTRTW